MQVITVRIYLENWQRQTSGCLAWHPRSGCSPLTECSPGSCYRSRSSDFRSRLSSPVTGFGSSCPVFVHLECCAGSWGNKSSWSHRNSSRPVRDSFISTTVFLGRGNKVCSLSNKLRLRDSFGPKKIKWLLVHHLILIATTGIKLFQSWWGDQDNQNTRSRYNGYTMAHWFER